MILSLTESIQRFKAEIISQDWSLSPKKIAPLQAAVTCLKDHFQERKNILAMLNMAESVLGYAGKRREPVPPDFVDFLKETMAHVVNLYEEEAVDLEEEARLCKRVYGKFARLKGKVNQGKEAVQPEAVLPAPEAGDSPPEQNAEGQKAPGLLVRPITIGALDFLIAEEHISLLRPLSGKKRAKYLAAGQVPLKDFDRWFQSLSAQFKGSLARLENSRLEKTCLPLVAPRDSGLNGLPDHEAARLAVLSCGPWHGVLLCRRAGEPAPLPAPGESGGHDGAADTGEEKMPQLLNINELLQRQGLLLPTTGESNPPSAHSRAPVLADDCQAPAATINQEKRGKIMNDQRKNSRVPFQTSINLEFPDKSHVACEIADLSLKGVFVHGVTGHHPGENCQVSLNLVGSTSHMTLKMKGTVVREEKDGLALHFYEMDLDSFFHLKNILYYNSDDPDSLEDELVAQFDRQEDHKS